MTTGQAIEALTPDAFEIVRQTLNWSPNMLRAWDYDGSALGSGSCVATSSDNTPACFSSENLHFLSQSLAQPRPGTIDLGDGYWRIRKWPFPRLSATVGEEIVNPFAAVNPTLLPGPTEDAVDPWEVLETFLPRWFAKTTHVTPLTPSAPTAVRAFDLAGTTVVPEGTPLKGAFWSGEFFTTWVRAAVATVHAYAGVAFAAEAAGPKRCTFKSADRIRTLLGKQTVRVRLNSHGSCGNSEFNLSVLEDGNFIVYEGSGWDTVCLEQPGSPGGDLVYDLNDEACQMLCDRPAGLPGKNNAFTPVGSATINVCRLLLGPAMNAEYSMWWAQRLYWWGRYCDSPWLVFLALLCSRAALAEVCTIAGTILHELCHKEQNSAEAHCKGLAKNECSAFWWPDEFLGRMMARLGLPHPRSKVGQNQFVPLEQDSADDLQLLYGGPPRDGCEDYLMETRHCNLAARGHYARLRTVVPGKCTTQKSDLVRVVELNVGANLCS